MAWVFVPAWAASSSGSSSPSETPTAPSLTSRGKPLPPQSWQRAWRKGGWTRLLSGTTLPPSTAARGVESWISSLRDFHALHSQPQASGEVPTTNEISGQTSCGLSANAHQQSSFSKTSRASELSEPDRAYAAGLVDGEGSIGICLRSTDGRPYYYARLAVELCYKGFATLKRMQSLFGGSMGSRERPKAARHFVWRLGSKATLNCLQAIYPFLMIKKRQAEIAMQLGALGGGDRKPSWTTAKLAEAERLKNEMHRLNRTGKPAFPPGAIALLVGDRWFTSQMTLSGSLEPWSGPLPPSGMIRNGACFPLPELELLTAGSGSSYSRGEYATPSATPYGTSNNYAAREGTAAAHRPSLETWAKAWPTAGANDWKGGVSADERTTTQGRLAGAAEKTWPTPTSGDAAASGNRNLEGSQAHPGVSLTDAVLHGNPETPRDLWATPNAAAGTGYMSGSNRDTWRPTLEAQARGEKAILHSGRRDPASESDGPTSSPSGQTSLPLWSTPTAESDQGPGTSGREGGPNLVSQVATWPTLFASSKSPSNPAQTNPTAGTSEVATPSAAMPKGSPRFLPLHGTTRTTQAWGTPRVTTNGGGGSPERKREASRVEDQAARLSAWATPTQAAAEGSTASPAGRRRDLRLQTTAWDTPRSCEGLRSSGSNRTDLTTKQGFKGKLNPRFVEWMQALPFGWSDPLASIDSVAWGIWSYRFKRLLGSLLF